MKREVITPAKPDALARLKAFEDTVQAAFDKLNDDSAYADSDMALCRLFSAFEVAKDNLVSECKTFLEHGPVGIWPKGGAPFSEYLA